MCEAITERGQRAVAMRLDVADVASFDPFADALREHLPVAEAPAAP